MEISDTIRRLSAQLRLCVSRGDIKNAQRMTKAIENILAVESSPNLSTVTGEGDATSPSVYPREYNQQRRTRNSVSDSTRSSSSSSSTSASLDDKTSIFKFVQKVEDAKDSQVEVLLWHRGSNCCLNTMTPLQLSSFADCENNDCYDEILTQVPASKNPILILSVELTAEGTVSTEALRKAFASARRAAGYRVVCLHVHKWGKSWCSLWPNAKEFQDCCETEDIKLTVVKCKPETALDIPAPSVFGKVWAGHHAMAAFVTAHLSLIYPTWVVHREFDQWPDALLTKAKAAFQSYWPGNGYYSDNFVMSWFKDEFVGWSTLLANPTSISRLSSGDAFIDAQVEMSFRVNCALLQNGTVRLVFVCT